MKTRELNSYEVGRFYVTLARGERFGHYEPELCLEDRQKAVEGKNALCKRAVFEKVRYVEVIGVAGVNKELRDVARSKLPYPKPLKQLVVCEVVENGVKKDSDGNIIDPAKPSASAILRRGTLGVSKLPLRHVGNGSVKCSDGLLAKG